MKQLCRAAGMENTKYSIANKDEIAERLAQTTTPFVSIHIQSSTFAHENELSKKLATTTHKIRGITERLDDLCLKYQGDDKENIEAKVT